MIMSANIVKNASCHLSSSAICPSHTSHHWADPDHPHLIIMSDRSKAAHNTTIQADQPIIITNDTQRTSFYADVRHCDMIFVEKEHGVVTISAEVKTIQSIN